MEFIRYEDLTREDKWRLGGEYKNNAGKDELVIFLYTAIALALCFTVPLAFCGILWRDEVESFLIIGIVCCVLTPLLILSLFLVRRMQKKRAVTRAEKAEALKEAYGESALKDWYDDWYRHVSNIPEPKSAAEIALERAVERSISGTCGSYSSPSSKGSSDLRVKLKDGGELHTEERLGDYKTYLYDKDGKNTGLHVSGDKVLDESWHEVGSFDGSGKFIPKD